MLTNANRIYGAYRKFKYVLMQNTVRNKLDMGERFGKPAEYKSPFLNTSSLQLCGVLRQLVKARDFQECASIPIIQRILLGAWT